MKSNDSRHRGHAAVSLLDRVRAPRAVGQASAGALRASILEHLQAMCSTRLGSVPIRPDYGLPAISEMVHSFPDAINAIARALVYTIETYEPRLTQVVVRHVPSETASLVVRFEVCANLRGAEEQGPIHFATSIDGSRRVTVE